jgi:arylsulfatase A-like enzyme
MKTHTDRVSAMTLNVDIYPTILELAGVNVPDQSQGVSLVPVLAGDTSETRRAWYYEHLVEHLKIEKSEGVRTNRYKYLRFIENDNENELLFDLKTDPYEENNLANVAEYEQLVITMRNKTTQLRDALIDRS